MNLKGKAAVVTGASSGLGKEISLKLAKEGVKVALLARSENKLKALKNRIAKQGGKALVVPADLTNEDEVKNAVKNIIKVFGRLDVIVNNAGLGIFREIPDMKIDEWDQQIKVMLRGPFLMCKYALPHMYKQKKGHVINITSLWAKRFCGKCAGYTAAKFGLRGFTQSLREEARKHNVKVTNIMPGTINTPFFDKTKWEHDLSRALNPADAAVFICDIVKYPDNFVIEEAILESVKPDRATC